MRNIKDEILNLRKQGKTYNQISEELSCSKGLISYHLNPQVKQSVKDATKRLRYRKLEAINKLKEDKPCMDCGKFFEGYLMDFDHLPEHIKTERISALVQSAGWDRIFAEIAKCQVVCCMCHRKRTRDRLLTNPLSVA